MSLRDYKKISIIFAGLVLFLMITGCSDKPTENIVKPRLQVNAAQFVETAPYLGPSPSPFFVYIESSTDDVLGITFSNNSSWLTVTNPFFTYETPDSVLVLFNVTRPSILDVGVYYDTITINSVQAENSPMYVEVILTIGNQLSFSPESFLFNATLNGFPTVSQELRIFSAADLSFDYYLTTSDNWIVMSDTTGTSSETTPITVWVDPTGVTKGQHFGTLYVHSDSVENSPGSIIFLLNISSWANQVNPFNHNLNDVFFLDANNGWAVGEVNDLNSRSGYILKTTDGGNNWIENHLLTSPTSDSLLSSVLFFGDVGWISGEKGIILKTVDNGVNWNTISHPLSSTVDFSDLYFVNQDTGWVVGDSGYIIRTIDGGLNWQIQNSGGNISLNEVFFHDDLTGWAAGGTDIILGTVDGGLNWIKQTVPSVGSIGNKYDFKDIFFIDANIGYAIGKQGYYVYTTNGGQSWVTKQHSSENNLLSVYFADQLNGWIVGTGGFIIHTTDGGINWTQQFSGTDAAFNAAFFLDANIGWVVGNNGTILHTTSAGD